MSQLTVSRILFSADILTDDDGKTTIPLALQLLAESSNLPGDFGRAALDRHPIWSCSVRGFACRPCYHERGALLPHLFTLTRLRPPDFGEADSRGHSLQSLPRRSAEGAKAGGIFSVPLSVRLPCPGVTRRTALRSSDFPPACAVGLAARAQAGDRLANCDPSLSRTVCASPRSLPGSGSDRFDSGCGVRRPVRGAQMRQRLSVDFLFDAVLFQFLVQIAARRIDNLGGFRDVPVVLAQFLDEVGALRGVLELTQGAGAGLLG